MDYGILRLPHQNSRYDEATEKLMAHELAIVMNGIGQAYIAKGYQSFGSIELFVFNVSEALSERVFSALERLSSRLALFEISGDWLKPVESYWSPYMRSDFASILKYSGKTNEAFTGMMINIGIFSSDFAGDFNMPLTVFDPMSGRGTTLYKALMVGYHATGVELNKQDAVEMNQYVKRYLKYHHYKHETLHQTIVKDGKQYGTKYTITTADTKEHYKAGEQRSLQFASGDTVMSNLYHKKRHAHVLVTDLPYGVQHSGKVVMTLLQKALPVWHAMLKTGGVAVVAYNTYHLDRAVLVDAFKAAGYNVMTEAPYDDFEHWVEQAVNRDIIVAKCER
ncbi:hypothetical protein KHM83_12895 [Fusibacter paucivorans]|uniref:Ribosomal RNA large subunit methyltransferase K/L-like methyltransferase domain-containing protein n=1 Tax=Fusibacter paucivorans TaxID=76009 RepID=A0ABS5PQY8_9FIRM|nr:hypothetical protein [Fusibacter paucivorans]MBS7527575.1 hypothetical protein [Fusibacter paucivorans]